MPAADAVPARPRPDRPHEGVPAAEAQDAGLRRPGRRPLPHAADAHARDDRDLARRRAGAAAERGPRRGDRARPRPRAHAVRPRGRGGAGRGACASASAAASATTSTRCGWSTCSSATAAASTSPHEVRDGILNHTGPNEPDTLEGRIVRLVDRVAYINHDIDDAVRAGVLDPAELPQRRDRAARPDRLAADRHARPRPRRDLRPARATSARARRSARRCSRCARSCSSASTSARRRAPSTRGRARRCSGSSTTCSSAATPSTTSIDYVAGMTDRFALSYAESL